MGTGLFSHSLSGSPGSACTVHLQPCKYGKIRVRILCASNHRSPGIALLSPYIFPCGILSVIRCTSAFPIMAVIADQMAVDPMPRRIPGMESSKAPEVPRTGAKIIPSRVQFSPCGNTGQTSGVAVLKPHGFLCQSEEIRSDCLPDSHTVQEICGLRESNMIIIAFIPVPLSALSKRTNYRSLLPARSIQNRSFSRSILLVVSQSGSPTRLYCSAGSCSKSNRYCS